MLEKNRIKKSNITFLIFAFNEEKRIEYPVKCFLPYGDVLIIDNLSTDRTCEIAKNLGASVIRFRREIGTFAETPEVVDRIYKNVKTDWVFWGMADEMVPKTCLELYKKIASENKYKVVVQKKKTLLFDEKSEFLPCDITVNFFRKDSIDFRNNRIHQTGKFAKHVKPDEILYLPPIDEYSVYHFSNYITENLVRNFNIYTTEHAKNISHKNLEIRIILEPMITFVTHYLQGGAIWRGIRGLIVSLQYSYYSFLALVKAYELKYNINLITQERNFAVVKKELLKTSPKSSLFKRIRANLWIYFLSKVHKYYKFRK
ncbi:hypothetical protein HY612_02595 [Candidatus Roizmanbacteria bacterium]|nr:hypothetical protein [Candidatus Roizmanbacteria bacterium]